MRVQKVIQIDAGTEIVKETKLSAVLDAHSAMGQLAATEAMQTAIKKAKQHGIGMVQLRNSNHYGIAGYYALLAAKEHLLGVSMTNSPAIRDVLLFPTMKSLDSDKKAGKSGAVEEATANDNNGFFKDNAKIDFSNVKVEPLFEEEVDFDTFSKSDFRAVKVKECVAVPKSKKLLQFTLDDGTGTDRTILSGIHSYYEPEELVGKTLIAITNLPPRKMMGIESCGMLLSAVNNLKDSEDEELHLLMVDNHIPAGAKLY